MKLIFTIWWLAMMLLLCSRSTNSLPLPTLSSDQVTATKNSEYTKSVGHETTQANPNVDQGNDDQGRLQKRKVLTYGAIRQGDPTNLAPKYQSKPKQANGYNRGCNKIDDCRSMKITREDKEQG